MKALVTGGASPIGAAICRRLARDGHQLLVHAHANRAGATALCAELEGAAPLILDLSDRAAAAAALEAVLESGPIQLVVHAAGSHDDVPMAGMSDVQWDGPIDTSLNAFFAVLRPLLLPMMATRWGRVVAISSVAAQLGNRGQVSYAAAKAGLVGAVRSLAREVATRGITANAVLPGIIASPAVEAAITAEDIARAVPMKRAGRPEEVADLVGFLCSREAAYISGQAISINGGMA